MIDYSYSKEVNTQPFFFFLLILFYLKADLPPLEGDADYEEDGGGVAEVAAGLQDGEHQPAGAQGVEEQADEVADAVHALPVDRPEHGGQSVGEDRG